jgi:hypothetical protein
MPPNRTIPSNEEPKNLTIFKNGNNSIYRAAFERMEAKFIELEAPITVKSVASTS